MTTLNEGMHRAEFLLNEEEGKISREVVTLAASAAALSAGTVLGKVTATGKYLPYSNAASDGTETAVAILFDNAPDLATDQQVLVIARLAEVQKAALTGIDTAGVTDLLAQNIICR